MNLEQLQSFLTVAETGHFTNAAAELHVAQPTLSRHISTLETELGSELFNRARGNITLTAAGETLLPVASRMLADAEHIRFQMQELAGLRRGRVRLGAPPSMCVSVVAEVVGPYHQAYPGVDLHL
ncbi:MAG: LysR family transcriptional regulator, partial [Yaniella sp.]|uniref:LysR family transcriptional regulator n=1 Tax=Yaniella sp. TaxID=2773929 RepID=UPI002649B98D